MAAITEGAPGAPRLARDIDAQDLFGLLALCFAEYPGCFVDPHDDLPDVLKAGTAFAERGGIFWVVEDPRGRVAACIAIDFPEPGTGELHRLYVRPDLRGQGTASRLVELAEAAAVERGCRRMILWSDTRFTRAHRLYDRLGYQQGEVVRDLGDVSNSREHFFDKALPAGG